MLEPKPLTVFFSVGEPSGDIHGANLIRQLDDQCDRIEAVGFGGPMMAEAGCRLHADLTRLAVMWFSRAILHLHEFWNLLNRADRVFRYQRPDAVVLVDFPGFNWWIAWRAKVHGIPVFYYVPPQIWAWARWRVKKMRRLTDHVLSSLPFETAWFREHGVNATFVGHPFFDEVEREPLDTDFLDVERAKPGPLVTILPGSRTQEVQANLEGFLKAAAVVREKVPDVRLAVAAFKPHQAEMARKEVAAAGLPVDVHVGKTPELIHLATCCMAVSGSVSLELLYHTKPTVIQYQVSRFGYFLQGIFRKVKYITLVNLLAAKELSPADRTHYDPKHDDADQVLFPEYLTCEDRSSEVASHAIEWLTQPDLRETKIDQLEALKREVAHGGASRRAAEHILRILADRPVLVPRPHVLPAGQGMRRES